MNYYSRIIAIAAGLGLATGCASISKQTSEGKVAGKAVDNRLPLIAKGFVRSSDQPAGATNLPSGNPEALARFATGVSLERNDKLDAALDEFEKSALADPANEDLVVEVARRFLEKKQPEKALRLLSKAAERPGASGQVLTWEARALLQTGKTNAAERASRLAVNRAPGELEGYQVLAEIRSEQKQFGEVRKILDQAARRVEAKPAALIRLAELYCVLAQQDTKQAKSIQAQAIKLLDRVAATKPGSASLQRRMAGAYHLAGESKRAAEIYKKLLDAYAESPEMRNSLREELANIYLQSQDKKAAIEELHAIVKDNPLRYPQVWYVLGSLAVGEKKYAEAVKDFEQALLLDPKIERAYYELALAQIDLHSTDDALVTLERARQKFPDTFSNEFFTGLVYSRMKDYSKALKHFTTAEVIARASDPTKLNSQFYFQMGAAYERSKNYKDAETYFQKCIEMAPDFSEALNYLGYMWAEREENLPKAKALIDRALKLEPKNGAFLDSMGWVLFQLKQPREALPCLLKAIEYTPEPDPTVYDHLGDVYRALQQPEKAREAWKKSLAIEPNKDIEKKLQP